MLIETLQTVHTFHVVEMTEIRMEDGERETEERDRGYVFQTNLHPDKECIFHIFTSHVTNNCFCI